MPEMENQLELQQRLSMLAQLYSEIQLTRGSGVKGQSLEYVAEFYETAEPIFGEQTPRVLELIEVIEEQGGL